MHNKKSEAHTKRGGCRGEQCRQERERERIREKESLNSTADNVVWFSLFFFFFFFFFDKLFGVV